MPGYCPNCGAPHPADEVVCPSCGLTLPGLQTPLAETTRPEHKAATLDPIEPVPAIQVGASVAERRPPRAARAPAPARAPDPARASSAARTTVRPSPVVDPGLIVDSGPAVASKAPADALALPAPQPADEFPTAAPSLRIGYAPDNDLVIPVPQVSSYHAALARSPDGYVLKDLRSTNGTSVNGHRITQVYVKPGDRIGLGSYTFTLDHTITERLGQGAPLQTTESFGAVTGPQPRGTDSAAGTAATANSNAHDPLAERLTRPVVIGRDLDCDVVLDAPQISRRHVRLQHTPAGWRVEDLGSANGTFVNDRNNRIDEALVAEDDVLFLGSYRFPVARVRDFLDASPRAVQSGALRLPADKPIVTIGRGPDNDLVLDGPQISRHHARIIRTDEGIFLEDLGSANGTFVDGVRIQRARLDVGAADPQAPHSPTSHSPTLSFGSYAIRLDLDRGTIQKSYQGDILLQAEHLRVEVDDHGTPKRILDGVSFTVYPTEIVGLLGPSGAGKTTLLMALIGYLRPTYGRTLLNGDELITNYDLYRGAIGYVPQEDIIHSELTVYEALYYTAKLRLPPDTSDEEIERRIYNVLSELEILETRHVRIGSPEKKGISGGQRKRVNLAMELLTEPSLLCLDEPTSGLASEDALNVITLLRKLADGGRTILLTIHQPSLQVYRLLDNTLYLADGEMVYYGPSYPDSLLYFHPELRRGTPEAEAILADPGSCMRPLVTAKRAGEPMETFAARYRQSAYHEEFVVERRNNRSDVRVTGTSQRRPPRFSLRQWLTLTRRYLNIKLKDRVGTLILLVQAPIVAGLLDLVFIQETGSVMSRMLFTPFALFLLVVSAIWFGCSNAAREIVSEQAIYKRERMVNLSITAYVASKFTVLAMLCLVQCVMLLAGTYFVLDFHGNPLYHLAVLWLCSLSGVAMGLMLSALVRTSEAAIALVPILLIPQVILGGAIMPVDRMSLPTWVASHTVVSRWGFEGALQSEHLADAYELSPDELPRPIRPGLPAPPPPPNPLDRFFGDSETWLAVDLGVAGGFTVLLLLGVGVTLRLREEW